MEGYEKLFQILDEEYGISTPKQLDEALEKLGYLDITRFCGEHNRRDISNDGETEKKPA